MRFRPFATSPGALKRDELVDVYLDLRPRIERVIARRTGSLALAADLAQEMFFKIDAIHAPLATRADAERYFLRVATNASLDHIKVEARRREILEGGEPVAAESVPSPERGAVVRDQMRLVDTALDELPPKCRDVLLLSRVHGYSHAEIALKLGVSQSLVEKYIVRALLHCRQRLND